MHKIWNFDFFFSAFTAQIHGIRAKRFVLLLLFSHFTRICKLNFPFIIFQFHLLQFCFLCFFLQILHLVLCTQCHRRKKENLVQITIHLASKHLQISFAVFVPELKRFIVSTKVCIETSSSRAEYSETAGNFKVQRARQG